MSREWQQTKMVEYLLPDEVYYQCLWAVRDLKRMERLSKKMKNDSNFTPLEVLNMEARVRAIYNALGIVPEAYRGWVMKSIVDHDSGRDFPNKFWRIWKQKFIYNVAKNLAIV